MIAEAKTSDTDFDSSLVMEADALREEMENELIAMAMATLRRRREAMREKLESKLSGPELRLVEVGLRILRERREADGEAARREEKLRAEHARNEQRMLDRQRRDLLDQAKFLEATTNAMRSGATLGAPAVCEEHPKVGGTGISACAAQPKAGGTDIPVCAEQPDSSPTPACGLPLGSAGSLACEADGDVRPPTTPTELSAKERKARMLHSASVKRNQRKKSRS